MKIKEIISLSLGLFLAALGIVLVTNANMGAFPITALNLAVSKSTGITFGTACVLVELIVLSFNIRNKENIGISTVANSIVPGFIMDGLLLVIPTSNGILMSILMLILGMIIFSLGQYFITKVGRGNGAMNGLMNVVMKNSGKSVFVIRTAMEIMFMGLAYILGGPIGIATLVLSFGFGYVMSTVFKLLKFKPEEIEHKYIKFTKKKRHFEEIIIED